MTERKTVLQQLLMFSRPLPELRLSLSELPWDSDELVILKPKMIVAVLQRYLTGELSSSDMEDWANTIEGREDIGYEPLHSEALKDIVFELANPELTKSLDKEGVNRLIERLP